MSYRVSQRTLPTLLLGYCVLYIPSSSHLKTDIKRNKNKTSELGGFYKTLLEPPEDPSGHNVILQETLKIFTPIRASRNSFGTLPKPPGPPKPQKTSRALKETPHPPVSSRSPLELSGSYKTLQEPSKDPSSHNMTHQEPSIQFTNFWLTFPPLQNPRTLWDLPRLSRTSHLIPRSYFFNNSDKIQI